MSMPSTYLELCQDTLNEAGLFGITLSTVSGQSGKTAQIIRWVNQTYIKICNSREAWNYLRDKGTFQTVSGTDTYAITSLNVNAENIINPVTCYKTATGVSDETKLQEIDFNLWERTIDIGSRSNGKPTSYTKDQDKNIILDPVPDDIYAIESSYYLKPTDLVNDADEPLIPLRHRSLIVWGAVMLHAGYEGDSGLYQHALNEYNQAKIDLERDELPKVIFNMEPLA